MGQWHLERRNGLMPIGFGLSNLREADSSNYRAFFLRLMVKTSQAMANRNDATFRYSTQRGAPPAIIIKVAANTSSQKAKPSAELFHVPKNPVPSVTSPRESENPQMWQISSSAGLEQSHEVQMTRLDPVGIDVSSMDILQRAFRVRLDFGGGSGNAERLRKINAREPLRQR